MSDPTINPEKWRLENDEKLLLQMLLSKKEWAEKTLESGDPKKKIPDKKESETQQSGESWKLTSRISLYPWQKSCMDLWFKNNGHGTIKVVTGAGKTILALSIIERLKNQCEPNLRVAIIVPTIVLMHQWFDEFRENTNISMEKIGFLGDNFEDTFEDKKILICVINSAQKKLPKIVDRANVSDRLFLIVDECHRSGSDVMRNIYKTQRKYSLGLSATPEREMDIAEETEEDEKSDLVTIGEPGIIFDEQVVGKEIGPIIFELSLDDAYKQGILPSFEIRHYGLQLSLLERNRYESLTKEIREIKKHLLEDKRSQKYISERDFNLWLNQKSKYEGPLTVQKLQYLTKVQERKRLLYQSKSRKEAVLALLKKDLEVNPKSRILIFHEIIDESMDIWNALKESKIHALPENSKLSENVRSENIELFRQNLANVLVSVKSLVEGFNVPSVDTGIIVASSTSVRQRIQTLGRLLRRHRSSEGIEKHSVIDILYIANTVDDRIYSKVNWGSITGAERNLYYTWDILQGMEPVSQQGPPRTPPGSDDNIDESKLQPGFEYPGAYEGIEFSADSQGNVYYEGNRDKPIQNPQNVPELLQKIKNALGRFKVTPNKLYVLTRIPIEGEWKTLFITRLNEPFRYRVLTKQRTFGYDENIKPGMEIPNYFPKKPTQQLTFKRKGNEKIIAVKIPRGELYVRTSDNAEDPAAGIQADELKIALDEVEKKTNRKISKFSIDSDNFVYTLIDGCPIFVTKLSHNLEFPLSTAGSQQKIL